MLRFPAARPPIIRTYVYLRLFLIYCLILCCNEAGNLREEKNDVHVFDYRSPLHFAHDMGFFSAQPPSRYGIPFIITGW